MFPQQSTPTPYRMMDPTVSDSLSIVGGSARKQSQVGPASSSLRQVDGGCVERSAHLHAYSSMHKATTAQRIQTGSPTVQIRLPYQHQHHPTEFQLIIQSNPSYLIIRSQEIIYRWKVSCCYFIWPYKGPMPPRTAENPLALC
eukprot:GHUV01026993.1.p1 GENE.GHUV01026993.1~~GHUV01026993.1.p1  ORF type:complete len:143 (+),score=1.53 GHUV01026993.1:135-563(+)